MPASRQFKCCFLACLAAGCVLGCVHAWGAEDGPAPGKMVFYAPHWCLEEYEADSKAFVEARPLVRKILSTPTITFDISYEDAAGAGFFAPVSGPQRMQRLEDALTYVAAVLNTPGELEVRVEPSLNTASGTLASAGTFYSTLPGFSNGTAYQRLSTGTKPFPTFPEIRIIANFGYNWNITTNPPSASQFDFLTVMVHEITHGLGFASLANSAGVSLISPGVYSVFDSFLVRDTGNKRLFSGTPPTFKGTTDDLRSRDLIMDGASSQSFYAQGVEPGIYAPNPFSLGSSLSHWDTGKILGNAVMEHAFPTGYSKRAFAPVDIGALRDIGYAGAAAVPGGEGEGEGEGEVSASVRVFMRDEAISVPVTNATARLDPVSVVTTNNVNGTYNFTVTSAGTYKVSATATGYRAEQTPNFTVNSGTTQVNLTLELEPLPPASLSVSPNPGGGQSFGSVAQGESAEVNFVVTNTGGGRLSGAGSVTGAGFSAVGNTSYLLAQGQNVTITIRFTPSAGGAFSGTATFSNTAGSNVSISLSGTGTVPQTPPPGGGCGCGALDARDFHGGDALLVLVAAFAFTALARRRGAAPAQS